ncbi:hypothetical protein ABZS61_19725 [Streptomyces sp. NPDC005566]|uniref:hypothetical protein n=1 Tax=Streptomyces sp. NPDC005566 TaxID=3156886 RepID=UPI00339DE8DE
MFIRSALRAAVPAVILGAVLVGCSEATTTSGPGGDVPQAAPDVSVTASATADGVEAEGEAFPPASPEGDADAGPNSPELVRDAFAGLQATLNETCTPGAGDCAYFLGRVNEELAGLDAAMKADAKGPGHFKEPLAWMGTLRTELKNDTSTANLEKHRTQLIGTRDRINTWMQGHPDDYR